MQFSITHDQIDALEEACEAFVLGYEEYVNFFCNGYSS